MNRSGAEIRASENQSKFIQDRISQVEKHFGELCQSFGAYTRKLGRLRDKGDDVAITLRNYSEHETLNRTTQTSLKDFSENMAAIQDYRETEIKRIDAKVIEPLTVYGTACKHAKERLKSAFATRDKEMKQKKALDRAKDRNPSDRATISMAETELHKASVDATWSSKALEEEMDSFERKKLMDIKRILFDFVNVELLFHTKSLELYSQMHHNLACMSEDEDLEEFRNSLRPPSTATRLEMARAASGSRNSLNTTAMSGVSGVSRGSATPTTTPTPNRHTNDQNNMDTLGSTNPTSMYSSTTLEDDDDEDEDDDDEEEEEDDDEYSDENDSYANHYTAKADITPSRRQ